jgi:hypothetical protein
MCLKGEIHHFKSFDHLKLLLSLKHSNLNFYWNLKRYLNRRLFLMEDCGNFTNMWIFISGLSVPARATVFSNLNPFHFYLLNRKYSLSYQEALLVPFCCLEHFIA